MSRRFSDEPINLIHRIPTPEQMSAVRPSKQSFGEMLVEAGAVCVRAVVQVFAQIMWSRRMAQTDVEAKTVSQDLLDGHVNEPIASTIEHLADGLEQSDAVRQRAQTVATSYGEGDVNPPQSAAMPAGVQQEEVAELRAYLLSQQQDIARLSAQIQELKSLVVSQQQVLGYLGRELEVRSLPPLTMGVASAPAKRNRPVRQKSGMKDKAVAQKDVPNPSLLSF